MQRRTVSGLSHGGKDHAMAQRAKKIAEENSHHDCDFRDMLSRVGDKWSVLVVMTLRDGSRRYVAARIMLSLLG